MFSFAVCFLLFAGVYSYQHNGYYDHARNPYFPPGPEPIIYGYAPPAPQVEEVVKKPAEVVKEPAEPSQVHGPGIPIPFVFPKDQIPHPFVVPKDQQLDKVKYSEKNFKKELADYYEAPEKIYRAYKSLLFDLRKFDQYYTVSKKEFIEKVQEHARKLTEDYFQKP